MHKLDLDVDWFQFSWWTVILLSIIAIKDFSITSNRCMFPYSTSLPASTVSSFIDLRPVIGISWNLKVVLICISLMTKDAEHFFKCFSAVWVSSFENSLLLFFKVHQIRNVNSMTKLWKWNIEIGETYGNISRVQPSKTRPLKTHWGWEKQKI